MMLIKGQQIDYQWQDNWGGLNGGGGNSHNGIAIDSQGLIYASFPTEPHLRVFNPEGEIVDSFPLSGKFMHCLFISKDSDGEWLWNVDVNNNLLTKSTLKGELVTSIGRDAFKLNEKEKFNITAATADPLSGNIWVTDGYGWAREGEFGGNRVFCFSPELELLFSFDGSEDKCGVFYEPHWIFADIRKGRTEIYIADRRNHRLVVYSAKGEFLRSIDEGLNMPSGFATFDDKLVVAELEGRLHILDAQDNIIETLCDGREYSQLEGWPNRKDENGQRLSPVQVLEPGKFNSPHGITADHEGNIFVHEWHLGVRITKLCRVT
jgi:sugar lactone lactonase YvrE